MYAVFLAGIFAFFCHGAYSQDNSLKIESDTVVHDLEASKVTFKGNVLMSRNELRVEADSVEYIRTEDNVETAHAYGSPVDVYSNNADGSSQFKATADEVILFGATDEVHLKGGVSLEQQNVTVTAPMVVYDVETKTFETKGDTTTQGTGRTTATIFEN